MGTPATSGSGMARSPHLFWGVGTLDPAGLTTPPDPQIRPPDLRASHVTRLRSSGHATRADETGPPWELAVFLVQKWPKRVPAGAGARVRALWTVFLGGPREKFQKLFFHFCKFLCGREKNAARRALREKNGADLVNLPLGTTF